MKNNKLAYSLMAISFLLGIGVAIPFGGAIAMTSIALGSIGCVLSYVFLSEPKKRETEQEKQPKQFLNVGTAEKNEETKKTYQRLHSVNSNVTFKGNHKIYKQNEDNLDDGLSI